MDTNKQTVEEGVKSSGDKLKISSSLSPKAENQLEIPSPSEPKKVISPPKTKLESPHEMSPESKIPSQHIETHTPVRVSSRISERKKTMEKSLNSESTTTSTSEEISTKQEEEAVNEDIVKEDVEHIPPQSITNVPIRVSSRISERKKKSLNETLETEATNSITSEETNSKQNEEAVKEDVVSQDIEEIRPQTTTDVPVRISSRISERKNRALAESRKSAAETPSTSEETNPKQNEEAVEKEDMVIVDIEMITSEHEEPPSEIEDSGTDSQANQPRHKINIEIGEKLKKVLEQDFHLINNKNKLIALPAQPTVISILESWVLDYTTTLIEKMSTKRHRNREAQYIIDQTIDNINLCREMADGIRVYFDYTLAGLLLYGVERDQCNCMVTIAKTVSVPLVLEESITINDNTNESNITVEEGLVQRESPPKKKFHEDKENEAEIEKASSKASNKCTLRSSYSNSVEEPKPSESVQETKQETENVSRLTKSRSKSPHEEPTSSEPLDDKKQDTENLSSSASTSSKGSSGQGLSLRSSSSLINLDLVNELTGKTKVWRLVKDDKVKSSMPSNIYGAIHLVRLFVRLPDLLGRSDLTKNKLKIVLKYIRMFLSYLEIHEEWYGEQFYMLKTSFEESNTNP